MTARAASQGVLRVTDHGELRLGRSFFAPRAGNREAAALTARLGERFMRLNRADLESMGVSGNLRYDGATAELALRASHIVGGAALRSPTSGLHDNGIVVRPRFSWEGIGPTLLETGWKVSPSIIAGPALPQSDRETPLWVLSSVVLGRIQQLLSRMNRDFAIEDQILRAPRGGVRWGQYATQHMSRGQFAAVPCRVPELQPNRDLYGVIHYVLQRQHSALTSVRADGAVTRALLETCSRLMQVVSGTVPRAPRPGELMRWKQDRRLTNLEPGIEAIEWTVEERGLAGLSDLRGLPWRLSMSEFFEAWVERIAEEVATRIGGTLRRGRLRETLSALDWRPSFSGSQRFLLPDLVLENNERVVVFDAKYKHHWSEFGGGSWREADTAVHESHRADLMQVLAYSSLFEAKQVSCVLVYPCRESTWEQLLDRGQSLHRADLRGGTRNIQVLLAAVPFGKKPRDIIGPLTSALAS